MERNKESVFLILSFFYIVCTFTADLQSPGALCGIVPAGHLACLMKPQRMLSHFDVSSAPVQVHVWARAIGRV